MHIKFSKRFSAASLLRIAAFGTACIVGSFVIGIESAGEVDPVGRSEALEIEASAPTTPFRLGDVNRDGTLDIADAILVLEIVQGYREPTTDTLKADPNGDYRLDVSDALRILRTVAIR